METQNRETIIIQNQSNGAATTALLLGIIGFIVGLIPYIGWLMAPVWLLAIVFGLIGMRKKYKRGTAIIGFIFGLLGAAYKIGFWIVATGGILAASYTLSGDTNSDYVDRQNEAEFSKVNNFVGSQLPNPGIFQDYLYNGDNGDKNIRFSASQDQADNRWTLHYSSENKEGFCHIHLENYDLNDITFEGTVVDTYQDYEDWQDKTFKIEAIDDNTFLMTIGDEIITIKREETRVG